MRREKVAGVFDGSRAGRERCVVMMLATPAPMAARKGARCTRENSAAGMRIVGRETWASTVAAPFPGKCLAQAATPEP